MTWTVVRSMLPLLVLGCSPPAGKDTDSAGDLDTSGGSPGGGDALLLCSAALTCGGNILDEPKAPCDIDIVSGDGVALYHGPAGVELRGRSSLVFPKPQYSVELRQHTELPVWPGSIWSYLDDGTDPGTLWMDPGFDDGAWATGAAPIGYGGDWLTTVVDSGPNPDNVWPTIYYRYHFTPADRAAITQLTLGVLRNDAAAVWLNGTEILRENLDEGANYLSHADQPISATDELLWLSTDVTPALLVDGSNVLAVEIHQAEEDGGTSRFDAYLEAGGDAVDVDLLGMGEDSDWILNGMYADRVLFRNKLAFDLFQSFGGPERYAPEGAWCELTLDGAYQGIYSLGEKIKRGPSRVDLEEGDPDGASFIIKLDDEDGFHVNSVGVGTWQLVYPEADPDNEAEVSAFLTGWEDAIHGADPTNAETGAFAWVDMASAVDWVLLQELMRNVDAYSLSVYLWRDVGGRAFFTPWDLDLSMGYPYTDCSANGWNPRLEFVESMAADPTFSAALAARWADLRQDQLSEEQLLARIAGYDATLAPALAANVARWPVEDIAFATDGVDNWLCPVASYEEEHERVLDFLTERLAWMDANIGDF